VAARHLGAPRLAPDDYEHPLDEIDGAMIEAFELYDVWRVYVDPQYIEHSSSAGRAAGARSASCRG
jgi:hypothetical protein